MPETSILQSAQQTTNRARLAPAKLLQFGLFLVVWLSTLFIAAGTLHWKRGWLFVAVYAVSMTAIGLAVEHWNPGLMVARTNRRHKDTKQFDKVFLRLHCALTGLLPALAGLDAVRFRWSSMPEWTAPVSVGLFLLASILIAWTLAVNPWAEFSVRIQTDRGHHVVSSGPYRYVRHPMYVGSLVMYPAMAGMLGSMWALALTGITVVLFVWRTSREDATLREELPGYREYAAETHYRLVPGLW